MPKQKRRGPRASVRRPDRSKAATGGPLARGRQLHESGDLHGARRVYERVLEGRPDHSQALHLLGKLVCELGEMEQGMELIEKALARDPHSADAWCTLGDTHFKAGQLAEALDAYGRALALDREDTQTLYGLGRTYLQLGNAQRAQPYLQRVVSVLARSAEAQEQLGLAQHGNGEYQQAVASFRRSIEINPDAPSVHSNLAKTWLSLGRHDQAVVCMGRAVKVKPDWAALYVNLGAAQEAASRQQEAVASYSEAVRLEPDLEVAWRNLGRLLLRSQKFQKAAVAFRKALSIEPDCAERHYELATALVRTGDAQAGVLAVERAVELAPDEARMHLALAGILRDMGRYDDAESSIYKALELDPTAYLGYALLVFIKRFDDIEALEAILKDDACHGENARHIRFAVATLLDRKGEYERAFQHYTEANRLRDASYDRGARNKLQQQVERVVDRSLLQELSSSSASTDRPVFIFGMPRSGTTLVEQILDSHPGLIGVGENHNMMTLATNIAKYTGGTSGYPVDLPGLKAEHLREMAAEYFDELGIDPAKGVMPVDKTPGNFMLVGLIAALYPGARLIHSRRHPVDTCLSNFFNDFDGETCRFSYDLRNLESFYKDYVRMMKHWEEHLPVAIHTIDYEDMVMDTEGQVRKLLEYCELDWHDDCLNFHKRKRAVFTASSEQVRQPIYKGSCGRWKNYQPWLGPLSNLMD